MEIVREEAGYAYANPAKPGIHPARVAAVEARTSKAGKPQVKLVLEIGEASIADVYLTQGAFLDLWDGFVAAFLPRYRAQWDAAKSVSFDEHALVGQTCRVRTSTETFNEKLRTRVDAFLPAGAGDPPARAPKPAEPFGADNVPF